MKRKLTDEELFKFARLGTAQEFNETIDEIEEIFKSMRKTIAKYELTHNHEIARLRGLTETKQAMMKKIEACSCRGDG